MKKNKSTPSGTDEPSSDDSISGFDKRWIMDVQVFLDFLWQEFSFSCKFLPIMYRIKPWNTHWGPIRTAKRKYIDDRNNAWPFYLYIPGGKQWITDDGRRNAKCNVFDYGQVSNTGTPLPLINWTSTFRRTVTASHTPRAGHLTRAYAYLTTNILNNRFKGCLIIKPDRRSK